MRARCLTAVQCRTRFCNGCGLHHEPGELFVSDGADELHPLVDTCELESAWRAAHLSPMPEGSRAYHATDSLDVVLASCLDPTEANSDCKHICFALTPEIAAATMEIRRKFMGIPAEVEFPVLEVDVSGLDLFFEFGEARHHGHRLERERVLGIVHPSPEPIIDGWSDPFLRRQHSDCLATNGYPLSRRALRAAREVADRRYGYEHTVEQHRQIALELAAATAPNLRR